MKTKRMVAALAVVVAVVLTSVLAGCSQSESEGTTEAESGVPATEQTGARGASSDLDATSRLMLGTLELEDTGNPITPGQAAELLPLWQAIAGGTLQSQAETDAVLKQIEGKMSQAQLAAIDEMALTNEALLAWMSEQWIELRANPEGQPGGAGALQDLTEEERAQMREELQNMDEDERATRMAEMGAERPEGAGDVRPGGGVGQTGFLYGPLVELLSERAGG